MKLFAYAGTFHSKYSGIISVEEVLYLTNVNMSSVERSDITFYRKPEYDLEFPEKQPICNTNTCDHEEDNKRLRRRIIQLEGSLLAVKEALSGSKK